jgi:hypothetical protein
VRPGPRGGGRARRGPGDRRAGGGLCDRRRCRCFGVRRGGADPRWSDGTGGARPRTPHRRPGPARTAGAEPRGERGAAQRAPGRLGAGGQRRPPGRLGGVDGVQHRAGSPPVRDSQSFRAVSPARRRAALHRTRRGPRPVDRAGGGPRPQR